MADAERVSVEVKVDEAGGLWVGVFVEEVAGVDVALSVGLMLAETLNVGLALRVQLEVGVMLEVCEGVIVGEGLAVKVCVGV